MRKGKHPARRELEEKIRALEEEQVVLNRKITALQATADNYQQLFNRTPQAYQSLDEHGLFIDVNQVWLDLLGYNREEVIGKSFAEFIHPDWIASFMENFPRFKARGEVSGVEFKLVQKDGGFRMVSLNGKIGRDVSGAMSQTHCLLEDITAKKASEQALAESEKMAQGYLDIAGVIILALDKAGRITLINRRGLEVTGYQRDELIGRNWITTCLPPKRHREVQAVFKQLVRGEIEPVEYHENPVRCKDGRERTIAWHNTLLRDPDGNITGVLSSGEDITERKQSESALLESHETFLAALDLIPTTVYAGDLQTHEILFMNKHMRALYGDDLTGQICWKVFRNASAPCDFCTNRKLLDGSGKPAGVQVWRDHNPVTGRWYINYDHAVKWMDGRYVRLQIASDITDIKKLEKKRLVAETQLQNAQRMESIGTLAGGIAHDFNNILFPIIGYAEMLLEDMPPEEPQRLSVTQILAGALRARDLVKQILAFSRQADQEIKPLKVQLIIKEVLKLARASLPTTITIKQHIHDDCGMVLADPTQIHQVAMNLVTNAFHAMENTGGTLTVVLKNTDIETDGEPPPALLPGAYVHLSISDTGVGMNTTTLDRIFDPYYTTKEKDKGTGLGLAVVHGIVKSCKGEVLVKSIPGRGTVFDIYFPRIAVELDAEPESVLRKPPPGDEQVLLVDDEKPIVEMSAKVLERLGYRITARTSSTEALELFKAAPDRFDIVITDLTMPNMTGDTLAAELKKIRADVPVILFTGFGESVAQERLARMGVDRVLLKPVVRDELAVAVRELLDSRKA